MMFQVVLITATFGSVLGIVDVVGRKGLPAPHSIEFASVDENHVMKWKYPTEDKYKNVRFQVEVADSTLMVFFPKWESEVQCQNISNHQCEIISIIGSPTTRCPYLKYGNPHNVRVRACITDLCSAWTEYAEFDPKKSGTISPPRFEIEGIFDETKLKIINHPTVVKHTNLSLNCYHDNQLQYKIRHWEMNESKEGIEEEYRDFNSTVIVIRLPSEPIPDTVICVEMKTKNTRRLTATESAWRKKCFVYRPGEFYMDKSAKAGLIAAGCFVVLIIALVSARKFYKCYKYVYRQKIVVPKDLVVLVDDSRSPDNGDSSELKAHSMEIICAIPPEIHIKTWSNALDQQEALHLLSQSWQPPVPFTQFLKEEGSILDPEATPQDSHEVSYASEDESMAYVCSVDETESGSDQIPDKSSRQELCIRDCSADKQQSSDDDVCNQLQRDSDQDITVHPSDLLPASLTKKGVVVSAIDAQSSDIPDYALAKNSSPQPGMKLSIQDRYVTEAAARASNASLETGTYVDSTMQSLVNKTPQKNPIHGEFSEIFDNTDVAVSLTNPTYNPKPKMFDVLDDDINADKYLDLEANQESPLTSTKGRSDKRNMQSGKFYSVKRQRSKGRSTHNTSRDNIITPHRDISNRNKDAKQSFCSLRSRRESCGSVMITISPQRQRMISVDSGFHKGSFSVSDDCCSLSPPLSPSDIDDVFFGDNSPRLQHRFSKDIETSRSYFKNLSDSITASPKSYISTDFLRPRFSDSDATPYVTIYNSLEKITSE